AAPSWPTSSRRRGRHEPASEGGPRRRRRGPGRGRQGAPPQRAGGATMSLVEHTARLARALRRGGVRVALGDEIDAVRALERIDIGDRDEVRWALRCALKIRPRDAEAFERCFARSFRPPRPNAQHGPAATEAAAESETESETESESETVSV